MIPPLTPAGCDLRTMPYMPFQVVRFLQSDLVALATPAEGWAALQIWLRSWLQVPAASLPNDERILAKGAGLSLAEWREVSGMALRGWVEASDGRLYHPVVAEKALEAWIERLRLRRRSAIGNAKRYRREADLGTFDAELSDAVSMLSRLSPDSASRVAKLLEGDGTAPIGSPKPSPKEGKTLPTEGEGEGIIDIGANAPDGAKPTKVSPLAQPWKADADFLAGDPGDSAAMVSNW